MKNDIKFGLYSLKNILDHMVDPKISLVPKSYSKLYYGKGGNFDIEYVTTNAPFINHNSTYDFYYLCVDKGMAKAGWAITYAKYSLIYDRDQNGLRFECRDQDIIKIIPMLPASTDTMYLLEAFLGLILGHNNQKWPK